MISASDADDEIRAVTRRLLALAARAGVRMDRVAVLMPAIEPYARTVDAALTAAGVTHNGPPVRRLADTIAGRTLARLIGMVDSTFARDEVMAFLAGTPIRWDGGRPVPVDRWDLISRRAGVVDGDDWVERLDRYAAEMADRDRDRARNGDDPESDRAAAKPGSVAHSTIELAGFVARLRSQLVGFAAAVGWRDRVAQARRALEDVLGASGTPRRWPPEEQEAFDAVVAALDRLAALESVEATPAPGAFAARSTPSSRHRRVGSAASATACCAPRSAAPWASTSTRCSSSASPRDCCRSAPRGRAPGRRRSAARGGR